VNHSFQKDTDCSYQFVCFSYQSQDHTFSARTNLQILTQLYNPWRCSNTTVIVQFCMTASA